jgi:hypothetical protein
MDNPRTGLQVWLLGRPAMMDHLVKEDRSRR